MVKNLVVYPDDRIVMCGDVRGFDDSVKRLVADMRETMQAHGLHALSAIQVAHPFNIIVLQDQDGNFQEYINLRILKQYDRKEHQESTSYLPGITYTLARYARLRIMYEDQEGKVHYEDIEDPETAATLQRKLDFCSGASPLFKMKEKQREKVLQTLKEGGREAIVDLCPAFSRKDYLTSFSDKILFLMGLSLLTPLLARWFDWSESSIAKIYTFDKVAFPLVVLLMIAYFFYAQYEAKKYKQCSSCQIGNQLGIIAKRIAAAFLLALGAWLLLNPSSVIFS